MFLFSKILFYFLLKFSDLSLFPSSISIPPLFFSSLFPTPTLMAKSNASKKSSKKTTQTTKSVNPPVKKDKASKISDLNKVLSLSKEYSTMCVISKENLTTPVIQKAKEDLPDVKWITVKGAMLRKKVTFKNQPLDITGNFILAFCNKTEPLRKYSYHTYCRVGEKATEDTVLPAAEIDNRKLLECLKKGKVISKEATGLKKEYVVSKKGKAVETETQRDVLVILNKKISLKTLEILKEYKTDGIKESEIKTESKSESTKTTSKTETASKTVKGKK